MREALGFRLTEQLVSNEGHQLIVFFERSRQPHDIAFTRGANGGLHHFAFWLDSWSDVGRAADILRMNGIDIDVGPTRHGITRGHTIYFFDPVGNRNEVFSGGYKTDTDWETITWTEDQFGQGALLLREPRRRLVRLDLHLTRCLELPTTRDDAPAYLARYERRRAARTGELATRRRRARRSSRAPERGRRARAEAELDAARRAAGAHRGVRPRDGRAARAAVPRVVPQPASRPRSTSG